MKKVLLTLVSVVLLSTSVQAHGFYGHRSHYTGPQQQIIINTHQSKHHGYHCRPAPRKHVTHVYHHSGKNGAALAALAVGVIGAAAVVAVAAK